MKAKKVGAVSFRSRAAYVRNLLVRSKMSESEIARKANVTPQTVYATKIRMLGLA